MRIIKPQVIIEDEIDPVLMARKIELYVRKCYKSEGKMTGDSYQTFLKRIFQTRKHTGIAEHRFVTVTFVTDRGVSHEAVRHRMAAYLQESTRYCDYSGGLTFIQPPWHPSEAPPDEWWHHSQFLQDCRDLEKMYRRWRNRGWKAQQARYFLPNGIKTEYAATLNLGSWRNFLIKRTDSAAHPQMRQLAVPLLRYFQERLPMFYDDIPLPELPYEEAELIENFGCDTVPVTVVHED